MNAALDVSLCIGNVIRSCERLEALELSRGAWTSERPYVCGTAGRHVPMAGRGTGGRGGLQGGGGGPGIFHAEGRSGWKQRPLLRLPLPSSALTESTSVLVAVVSLVVVVVAAAVVVVVEVVMVVVVVVVVVISFSYQS